MLRRILEAFHAGTDSPLPGLGEGRAAFFAARGEGDAHQQRDGHDRIVQAHCSTCLSQLYVLHNNPMPEMSRFFGIIIRMYFEIGAPHHAPHFHAYNHDDVAVFSIESIELMAGSLPKRQQRLGAWAELHNEELMVDWHRLQAGQSPLPIAPLK